jgi:hypothetical protein
LTGDGRGSDLIGTPDAVDQRLKRRPFCHQRDAARVANHLDFTRLVNSVSAGGVGSSKLNGRCRTI